MMLPAALRPLRASPGFAAVVVLIMAVAIAATAAMFSVYDRLVLHPVDIPDTGSLVALWFNNPQRDVQAPAISIPRYDELRASARSFSALALSASDSFTLMSGGEAVPLNGLRVSASFLPTLGIAPARGRNFTEAEDAPNGARVCILSDELWRTQFGGRASIVGETLQIDGASWEVVGIMPPHFTPPFRQVQIFAPRVFEVGGLTPMQIQAGSTYAQPIARVRPGVTAAQIQAELTAFSRGYQERHPTNVDATNITEARDFVGSLVSGLRPTMYTLLGGVGCVLLIACANVASLFLSRLLQRRRDIALRLSLGATRARIIGQCLAESLAFSAAAGVVGSLLAVAALRVLQSVAAAQLPPGTTFSLDWRGLVFIVGITTLSALLTGLFPAVQASNPDVVEHLKDSARGSSSARGGRARQALIVAEVAMSVVLIVAAGLLLVSFVKLTSTPAGFDATGSASAFVSLPVARYGTPAQQVQFFEQALEALRAQPGVTDAAVVFSPPLTGGARTPYVLAGQPVPPLGQRPLIGLNVVSPSYFRLLGIRLAEGRGFTADDRATAPAVCVVNETFARRAFGGRSAIGQTLLLGAAVRRIEIVGVIRDVKSNGVNAPTPDEAYFPLPQLARPGLNLMARTAGDPRALQTAIRKAVAAVDPTQAISFFATTESTLASSLGTQRLVATLTGLFAALALLLSITGLWAVLAYLVSQRTPEIGIRMALGATRAQVVALVMRSGFTMVAIGLALGLASACAAARLIRQLLFGIDPLNPLLYAAVAALFAIVAALACLGPSLRASRIDPLRAFRA